MACVKPENIRYEKLCADNSGKEMLKGEIPGASVSYFSLNSGESITFDKDETSIDVFFLCSGSASFSSGSFTVTYEEKAVYVDLPENSVTVSSDSGCGFVKIQWQLDKDDLEELYLNCDFFPITEKYRDALQYRDPFKSEKTISRQVVKHDIIPRFAMGSVEAVGDDLIGQHSHPLLDQFFFSFEENDMYLLIDCNIVKMEGNTLLHIPLASNHGVLCLGEQKAHYLWLDFTSKEDKSAAVEYLNDVHKPTGVMQSL